MYTPARRARRPSRRRPGQAFSLFHSLFEASVSETLKSCCPSSAAASSASLWRATREAVVPDLQRLELGEQCERGGILPHAVHPPFSMSDRTQTRVRGLVGVVERSVVCWMVACDKARLRFLKAHARRRMKRRIAYSTGRILKDENVSILAAARGAIMMSCLIGKSI